MKHSIEQTKAAIIKTMCDQLTAEFGGEYNGWCAVYEVLTDEHPNLDAAMKQLESDGVIEVNSSSLSRFVEVPGYKPQPCDDYDEPELDEDGFVRTLIYSKD